MLRQDVHKLPCCFGAELQKIGATLGQDLFRTATSQGCSKRSLHQERCNFDGGPSSARMASGSSPPLIFDGGVGARHQQDPDDSDVTIVRSRVDWGHQVGARLVDVGTVLNEQLRDHLYVVPRRAAPEATSSG